MRELLSIYQYVKTLLYTTIFKQETREKKILKTCGNCCYCVNCNEPLNDTSECIMIEAGVYEYTCINCNERTTFNFYLAPVPILVENRKLT